ncbi:invasin domain 3-containing protein [Sanguibacter inulinus]|uniref:Ig-like domain-containing protein n=1 Tax=Sanguibacter inulinus TaxID=60922 RepID=A0A853EU99_9MICO|nr:invasin domain 3-containing protein [Sanguibacter inulinus]MBF0722994.1 Ig-like domain-containing protein [Sanguibacter inulinus]NYS94139.1 Ig-like domain-containing protein [Sanguibacter inulinus]
MNTRDSDLGPRPARTRRAWVRSAGAVAVTAMLASLLAVLPATTASAADRTFLVDSLSAVGDDATVGDGVCATAAGACTLRAALQESNAIGTTDTVTIAPAEDVDASTPGVQTSGTIVGHATTSAGWMYSGALTPLGDLGAYFVATAPVTLDFQGRLGIRSLNDVYGSTAIYLNGPGVTLRNFTTVRSNETAVVVGPAGDGAVIENGSSLDPGSIDLERFLWLADGADRVTVRAVEIGSTYAAGGSAIRIAAGATVDGLTLDRIHMYDPDTERYTGLQGQGAATLSNLTVIGSRFEGFGGANHALDLRGFTLTNAQIVGNTFTRNSLTAGYTLVFINTPGLGAPNVISGNTFDNAGANAGTTSYAVYALLSRTAAQQSGWRIEDNYFDGFTSSSVYLAGTGILTAQRNTFGTASYGGLGAGNETSAVSMLTNATAASNSQVSTWYPTATSYDSAQCTLSISVTPPSSGTVPTVPVSIDAYYLPTGATSGATVHLGRQTLSAAGQMTVPYTLGPGQIRVQTIDATGRASQYSRTVQQTQADLCGPRVTVDQAASQADPTSMRDLRFTVAVSEPLATSGAGALTASDFSTAGSTAPGTRVTAVAKVNDTLYTVTARADASGTVTLSLPAGAVSDASGNLSAESTSTDGSVTYVSPLTIAPTSVTVTEGDLGSSYTVSSTLAATAPILVAATVGTPAWATVDPSTASLPTTGGSVSLVVTAVDDAETDGTRQTTITHTVTSTDQNFDGLVLAPVDLTVLDDDVVDAALSTLTVEPGTAVADGVDSLSATVTARNAAGGLVAGVALVVSVAPGASPASTTCTTSAAGTCSVPVTSTTPGTYQVSATLGGAAVQGSPASVTFVAGPADATTSTISASVAELVADNASQSEITVQLRDSLGHPLTTSGGTVAIATSEGTVGPTTDNGDGTYSAILTAPSEVSVATVSFTLDAVVGARTTTVTFVPGDASPARSTIVAADPTLVADGAATTEVTVTLLDGFDNPLTASGGDVVVATSAGTVSGTTDNGDGTYISTLTAPTTTGTAVLSFTVDGTQATATTEVGLVAGPVDLTLSTITADPVAITADGTSTAVATVQLRDAAGNAVTTGGGDVVVSSDLGTLTGTVDQGNGTYTSTLTSTTTPGTATLTFTVDGVEGSARATVDLVVGSADPTTSTIDASPTSIVADGTSTSAITVRLRDSQGTALETSGGVVVVSTDLGSVSATTDNGDGTYSAVLTSSSTTGAATLGFAIGDDEATSTASVAFVPGPVDLGLSEISANPTEILADGSSTSLVSVQLKDAQGNTIVGSTDVVSITTDLGTVTATTAVGDGLHTATLTSSTTAGTATLGYAVGGIDAPGTAQVELLVGAVDLAASTIVATPDSIVADGTSTSQLVVQLRDTNGNPLKTSGGTIVISTDAGTVGATTDVGDGTYTAELTSATTVGAATLSFSLDDVPGEATATVDFTAGPAALTTSTIEASSTSITADGASSSTVTVRLLDGNGNPLTTSGGTVVIATDAGTVGATTDVGDGTYTAVLTSGTTAGTATLSFTLDDVSAEATATVDFTAGAADLTASTIEASPTSITADGTSTSTVTVRLLDANGNPLTSSGGTVVVTTDAGTVGTTTDVGDGTYTAELTSSTTAGTATLSFTLDDVPAEATTAVELLAGAADAATSTIEAAPTSITADGISTSTITVQLLDTNGNALTTSGGTVVIATEGGTVGPTTDVGDGTYTAELTSATTAGTATVSFSLDDAPGTQTASVAFTPGDVDLSASTISASPTTILADGTSTSTVTVTLLDANGNPTGTSGGLVVVATDLGTVGATTDAGDGTYSAVLTSARTAGTATVSFTLDGAGAPATAPVALTAGAVDLGSSTIEADPMSITADGVSTSTVTVRLVDANGNALVSSGGEVVVFSSRGEVLGTVDEGDGSYTAVLRSSTAAGVAAVGFTLGGEVAGPTVPVTFVAGEASAGLSEISASPASITADGASTSTITVRLVDANGNPLTTSAGTVAIATDAGTLGATTDVGDGTYTAELTSSTTAGTATLSFTLDDARAEATATVDLTAGAVDLTTSTVEASPTSITADGTSTSTVTVRLVDANGNPLTSSGGTVLVSTDLGSVSSTTDVGDGTYTATLTSGTFAGQATVTFAVDDQPAESSATVDLLPAAADLTTSTVEASPTSITADGTSTSTVTVRLLDANGNALTTSGGTVVVATDAGTVGATTDVGDGTYTAELTSSTTAGTATLSFTLDDAAAEATAAVGFVAGPADTETSTVEASPTSITADGASTSTVTVRLVDGNGNPLTTSGGAVVIATDAGTLGTTTDNGDGTYTAVLTSSTTTGTATLSFTLDDVPAEATATVDFTSGTADLTASTIEADPTTLTADGSSTSTVTVRLVDGNGNPLTSSGGTVVVTSDLGTVGAVTDLGDGSYTAVFTAATTVGTATLGFTLDGTAAEATATVDLLAGPADPTRTTVEVFPTTLVADGTTTATVTVRTVDAQGNPVTTGGAPVAVSTDLGAVGPVTDLGDGTYTATLTSATTVGTATISFTLDGAAGSQSAEALFVAGSADPARSVVAADPTTITADGVSTSTLTVRLIDANGNPLTSSGGTVVLITDAGSVSATTDQGDGTYTATLLSPTTTGTATVSFTVDGVLAEATAAVALVAGAADPTLTTIEASPGQIVADGVSTSTVTVRLRDALGNPIASSRGTVVVATDAGTVSGTTDVGDGTYTATLTSAATAGVATLTFTLDETPGLDTATVTFVAGTASPTTSTIEASPDVLLADGASTSDVTVRLIDVNGNPLTSSGGTVVVSTTAGSVTAATDDGDGTYSATYTAATTPGTAVLSFTVGGVAADETATVDLVVGAGDPTTSTISASESTLVVGDDVESVITVQLRDLAGNTLTTPGGAVVIATDAGTLSATSDNGDGSYSAVLTAPLVAGQATVSYTLDGIPGTRTLVVSFLEGEASPSTSQILAAPSSIVADGVDGATVTVRLFDGFGNPLVSSGGTVVVTTSLGDVTATTDLGDGTYTARLSGTSTGDATLGFSIDGVQASATTDVSLVAGGADPATSTVSASPTVLVADGTSTSAVTVRLRDAQGNPLTSEGGSVTLSTDLGTLSDVTDNGDGSSTATLTSATTAGTATVSFAVDGVRGTGTATVELVAGPPSPTTSTLTVAPTTIESGGVDASTLTVRLLDSVGNPLTQGGAAVVLSSDLGEVSPTVDHGDGTYTATLTSLLPGTATVTFTVGGTTADATSTVQVVDTTAAEAPAILAPTDGSRVSPTVQISGSGASGATLTVSVVGGGEICTVVVTTSGTWACSPAQPLPEGTTTFVATQVDGSGSTSVGSTPVSVVVDGTAPPAPDLDPTTGDLVTGLSEPGTTVTVSDSGGTVLCTATAGPDGRFVCDPEEQVPAGTLLSATATDEAGNTSEASFVRVGGASLTLEAESLLSGAEQVAYGRGFLPGETVAGLLESTPVDLGTQVADADGTVTFSFVLPADVELGAHTVTLTGERSGSVAADFEVVAAPVDPTPPTTPTTPTTPILPTAPSVAPGSSGPSAPAAPTPSTPQHGLLSRTGADPAGALVAAAAVLLGLLLLGASRRRRGEDV